MYEVVKGILSEAFSQVVANWSRAVGQILKSMTSQPAASNPATTAERTIGPDGRVSRQIRMRPPSRYVANACANPTATSGVNVSPTMPRTPVMPILSGFMSRRHCTPQCTLKGRKRRQRQCLTEKIVSALLKRRKSPESLNDFGDFRALHSLEYPLPIDENTDEVSSIHTLKRKQ